MAALGHPSRVSAHSPTQQRVCNAHVVVAWFSHAPTKLAARLHALGAPGRGFRTRSAAPVTSPASRCDRCSAFTQHPPDLACPSADLRASTSCLPQAGTKRQPGRRASGRCKVSSGVLTPLGRPPGPGGLMARRSPEISGEGPGLGAPAPAGCPGRLGGAQCDLHHQRLLRWSSLPQGAQVVCQLTAPDAVSLMKQPRG